MSAKAKIILSITMEHKTGIYLARCPELGLLATDEAKPEAIAKLAALMQCQIEYALKNNRRDFVSAIT